MIAMLSGQNMVKGSNQYQGNAESFMISLYSIHMITDFSVN